MAPIVLPRLPANLNEIQCYLDLANNYDLKDVSISYWSKQK